MAFRFFALFPLAGVLLAAAACRADEEPKPAVRDEAGLFSAEARQNADEEIASIRDRYHLDFVLETFAAPPEESRKQVAAMKAVQAAEFFKRWAAQRAEAEGVDGVYVLVCADPGYVQVTIRPPSHEAEFGAYDAKRLQGRLKYMKKGAERVKDRDARLLAAVTEMREDLRYNLRPAFPWLAVAGVIAGALGLWGVLTLVRWRLRAGEPREPARPSLYHALLGGMFGNVAGHWIYDSLFVAASRVGSPAGDGSDLPPAPAPQPAAADEEAEQPSEVEAGPPGPKTQKERLDLAAHDHPPEEPAAPVTTPF